ncbi:dolichol kinase [Halorhabdus sp. CBA1104]|uniref:dolichol kinase n=1 Tax=unclassified Halorhabdus TaxID=2621901 RepID=UPI0012B2824D|nr:MULTISPECIES: dolichol kinase [unclassified Halorhabdus]QGN07988.1 dolichol kinase [Halorhabdus sp. CBA1104]
MAGGLRDADGEIARRLVHASTSVVPLSYIFVDAIEWRHIQAFLGIAVLIALGFESFRLVAGFEWWVFDRLTRSYEQENLAGYFLGAVGLTVVAFAFSPPGSTALVEGLGRSPVAVPAMLMLTIADPFSGLLGSGELRTAKQAWVLLATFGLSTLLAAPFVPTVPAVLGGIAATVADGIKPVVGGYVIDDNLTIPIAAAVAMEGALTVL